MTDYQGLLARLDGVKQWKTGWVARCPAHEDRRPSLSLWVSEETGDLLCKCFAGCTFSEIAAAMGARTEDFLAERRGRMSKEVCCYKYHDEAGVLLYEVVRFDPKDFRCRRWVNGAADWALGDTRRVLYRLPQIIAESDRTVLLVEGEKSADRLVNEGFVATCSPGGAGKWREEYAQSLRGRRVVLMPDNDKPGRAHMEAARADLGAVTAELATLELDVPEKGDVVDWLNAGHTAADLKHLCVEALHAERAIRAITALKRTDRWRAIYAALHSLERE